MPHTASFKDADAKDAFTNQDYLVTLIRQTT